MNSSSMRGMLALQEQQAASNAVSHPEHNNGMQHTR
jgi:hypothetical protein